jgi:hypothetical protein
MEIFSYLRLTARRVVALTLVAGLAGAGAGYAVTRSPSSYQADATVFVGQALPSGSSSFDLPALVADFQAALRLEPVISNTAAAAALAPDDFTVVALRNGDGGTVRVTATAPTAVAAEAVASSISLEAMKFVTVRQVERAANLEAQRATEAEASRAALSKLDAANGFVDPIAQYATVQAQATRLQLDAENPGSGLTDGQRAGQLEQARTLRDSLPQLALKAQRYQSASRTVTDAEANVSAATRDRVAAESVQTSATSPESVAADEASPISVLPSLMRASGGAVLVTAAAGVGLIALLEERRRRQAARAALVVPAFDDEVALAETDHAVAPAAGDVAAEELVATGDVAADELVSEQVGPASADGPDLTEERVESPAGAKGAASSDGPASSIAASSPGPGTSKGPGRKGAGSVYDAEPDGEAPARQEGPRKLVRPGRGGPSGGREALSSAANGHD